jgi:hypothetical protein
MELGKISTVWPNICKKNGPIYLKEGSVRTENKPCEVRQFFRVRSIMKQKVSLVQQREMFRQRLEALKALVLVA